MENKGLNIFENSSLLVHPVVSTDADFEWVYGTIGHEYFHNWRGNRVTVKNWFQLSLKEGFASITDQEFTQALFNSMTPRIDDVRILQNRQFKQDAGPLAHAVLPSEYDTPDNIYTTTIYRKGAELLNMLKSLLGKDTFKQGCSIYFTEYDGKAASIEDFVAAMTKASSRNLEQFLAWYYQAGTPQLEIEEHYDENNKIYYLNIKQSCLPTPGQLEKKPLLIPIKIALLNKAGQEIPLCLATDTQEEKSTTRVLELTQVNQQFSFINVMEKPVPSLLRNFSAPVKIIKSPLILTDYKFLLKYDSDPVNQWLAAQELAKYAIKANINSLNTRTTVSLDSEIIEAFRTVLIDEKIESRLKSQIISFPDTEDFFESMQPVKPECIYHARQFFIKAFITACYDELVLLYQQTARMKLNHYYDTRSANIRLLKNTCLSYLMQSNRHEAINLCINQLRSSENMTYRLGALSPLFIHYEPSRDSLRRNEMDNFFHQWKDEPLVVKHIFNLYALSDAESALDQIKQIIESPLFEKENPAHTLELIQCFIKSNPLRFHDSLGKSYQFIADYIVDIDRINPATAADLARAFNNWKRLDSPYQNKMLEQLFRLDKITTLSDNVKEIINKSLKDADASEMTKIIQKNSSNFFQQLSTLSNQSNVEGLSSFNFT